MAKIAACEMAKSYKPDWSAGASTKPGREKTRCAGLLGTTAIAGLLTAMLVAPVRAGSSWTGAVSSDWFNAGNWSNGVSAANDTVLIQNDNLPNGAVVEATGATASGVLVGENASGVADNGTFDISAVGTGVSIQTLSGTGTVTLGANTLTLSNASSTYSGAIGGSGGLTLTTGTDMLSGTLSYQGNTTVNSGTLHLTLEWWCHELSERGGSRMLQGVVA
jgi:hypothetical protein